MRLFIGKGISYCASCDGAFFKGKDVAIVGGGDSAFVYAEYLSRLAKQVFILNRSEKFKANQFRVAEIEKIKNVEPIWFNEAKVRKEKFAELFETHDIDNICIVVKSLYLKQKELQENNKSLNLMDYDYLKKIKKGIEEELSIVLEKTFEEITQLIKECIGN